MSRVLDPRTRTTVLALGSRELLNQGSQTEKGERMEKTSHCPCDTNWASCPLHHTCAAAHVPYRYCSICGYYNAPFRKAWRYGTVLRAWWLTDHRFNSDDSVSMGDGVTYHRFANEVLICAVNEYGAEVRTVREWPTIDQAVTELERIRP